MVYLISFIVQSIIHVCIVFKVYLKLLDKLNKVDQVLLNILVLVNLDRALYTETEITIKKMVEDTLNG